MRSARSCGSWICLSWGGGGILFDAEAEIFLREVMIAHEMGIPVMVYAVSAGPLKKGSAQRIVREALVRAAVITVRDKGSKKVLEEAGVEKEVIVTADPALLLDPEPIEEHSLLKENLNGERRIVGTRSANPDPRSRMSRKHSTMLLADAADFIIDRFDVHILFVPMERRMLDMQHSHAVIARMLRPQRAGVLKGEFTSGQILTMMKRFEFAVGMRLHFLIFAAIQEVPFIGLPYASNVQQFLSELDLISPPLQLVNAGRLIAHLDKYWDSRDSILELIRRHLPALKERARENNRMATTLLERFAMKEKRPGPAECPT